MRDGSSFAVDDGDRDELGPVDVAGGAQEQGRFVRADVAEIGSEKGGNLAVDVALDRSDREAT